MENDFKKLQIFLKKEITLNSIVAFLLLFCLVMFVTAVTLKVNGSEDSVVDLLKLLLVETNLILMLLLLHQKKIFSYGAVWLKFTFTLGFIICHVGTILNLIILVNNSRDSNNKNDFLPFDRDFLTLGVTLTTDVLYLLFYILFQTRRAGLITLLLIIAEIVIFVVCAKSGVDKAVDIANVTLSLITCIMAVMLWSAKVVLNTNGAPLEFKDYFERDDLEEMELMISLENSSSKH
jgi:hypothetical protein